MIPGLGRFPGEGNGSHPRILAWKTPWTEEPGGLQSLGPKESWTQRATKQQQLIYDVVLVSGAQQSDSFIHIFILIQISIFFHIG